MAIIFTFRLIALAPFAIRCTTSQYSAVYMYGLILPREDQGKRLRSPCRPYSQFFRGDTRTMFVLVQVRNIFFVVAEELMFSNKIIFVLLVTDVPLGIQSSLKHAKLKRR